MGESNPVYTLGTPPKSVSFVFYEQKQTLRHHLNSGLKLAFSHCSKELMIVCYCQFFCVGIFIIIEGMYTCIKTSTA